jgi:arsenite methyltransferase
LREFHRILKPGGRLSMAEPVFMDDAFEVIALKSRIDRQADKLPPSELRLLRLMHRWKSSQYPDTQDKMVRNPITNYTERDLFRFANSSGFAKTRLELHLESVQKPPMSWQFFLDTAPHPLAKPLRAILAEQFTSDEREFFEKRLRPSIETHQFGETSRMAYLTAQKQLP